MNKEDIDGNVFLFNPLKDYELKKLENSHEDFQAEFGDLDKHKKKIFRFIILNYDINTPLRVQYKDYFKRKGKAAIMAGFKVREDTGKFDDEVTHAMLGLNDVVNGMIVRYLMNFYNEDYLQLITFWEFFGQFARGQFTEQKTKQNIQAIENIKKSITELTEKVFGGNESRELKKELYRALEMEKASMHPDYVAMELKEKKDMFKHEG
jgi:hypothetical protein